MRLDPYLFFDGRCEEAFAFYAATLGGTVTMAMKVGESPMAAHSPPDQQHKMLHMRLEFAGQTLMGSDDTRPDATPTGPSGFSVSLRVDDPSEAERLFAALSEGGEVGMPLQETFWARRFGMVKDRFGTPWMVNCEHRAAGGQA